MAHKVTNQVTKIGIDIGKNSFHLIGLDGRFGSSTDHSICTYEGPRIGVRIDRAGRSGRWHCMMA